MSDKGNYRSIVRPLRVQLDNKGQYYILSQNGGKSKKKRKKVLGKKKDIRKNYSKYAFMKKLASIEKFLSRSQHPRSKKRNAQTKLRKRKGRIVRDIRRVNQRDNERIKRQILDELRRELKQDKEEPSPPPPINELKTNRDGTLIVPHTDEYIRNLIMMNKLSHLSQDRGDKSKAEAEEIKKELNETRQLMLLTNKKNEADNQVQNLEHKADRTQEEEEELQKAKAELEKIKKSLQKYADEGERIADILGIKGNVDSTQVLSTVKKQKARSDDALKKKLSNILNNVSNKTNTKRMIAQTLGLFNKHNNPDINKPSGKGSTQKNYEEIFNDAVAKGKLTNDQWLKFAEAVNDGARNFEETLKAILNQQPGSGSSELEIETHRVSGISNAPQESSKGLFDYEIETIMKPFTKNGFMGVISADQIPSLIPHAQEILRKKPKSALSFIMNLDPADEEGSHWVAVYIDPTSEKTVEYYDSFGREPSELFQKDIKKLIEAINPETYLKFKVNKIIDQKSDSSTCGYHAIRFIVDRLDNKPFKECTGYNNVKKGEAAAVALKNRYKQKIQNPSNEKFNILI